MELAYVERGIKRALEHVNKLIVDKDDTQWVFKHKEHVRRLEELLKDERRANTLKKLESIEAGARIRNAAEAFGYLAAMSAMLNGEQGVKTAVSALDKMEHLPPEITAHIIHTYLLPHMMPPLGIIGRGKHAGDKITLLTRMKIRAVANHLPDIIDDVLREAEIRKEDLSPGELEKKCKVIEEGIARIDEAKQALERGNMKEAKSILEERKRELSENHLPIHPYYDYTILAIDSGDKVSAKMRLEIIRKGLEDHKTRIKNKIKQVGIGKIDRDEVAARMRLSDAHMELLGLSQEIDLGDASTLTHWQDLSKETLRFIEKVLWERGAKIPHIENINRLLRQRRIRGTVEKALWWAKNMSQEHEQAVKKLIWGLATNDSRVKEIIDTHAGRNGMREILEEIDHLEGL